MSQPIQNSRALSSRILDFWLLGGLSILVWILLIFTQAFRANDAIGAHFLQLAPVFSLLSIFCNHPHFMISYRIAYSRGLGFIKKNPISLLVVPSLLIGLYALAFFCFDRPLFNSSFGIQILKIGNWIMYLTVGWHYAKQVFGCIIVYSTYDQYRFSQSQRMLLKISLFSIAIFNFFYFCNSVTDPNQNFSLLAAWQEMGYTKALMNLSAFSSLGLAGAVLYFVFLKNYQSRKELPSINLLIPWFAFFIWWMPPLRQSEYYFLMIPFFHSLQYLPFAYRMEEPKIKRNAFYGSVLFSRIAILLVVGFLSFELIPNLLDRGFNMPATTNSWFFMSAFAVFINVHHFFIDSVTWRLKDSQVSKSLFALAIPTAHFEASNLT